MALINSCSEIYSAAPGPCSLPKMEITLAFDELMTSITEGLVTYNGEKVKSLNHLKKLHKDKIEKESEDKN